MPENEHVMTRRLDDDGSVIYERALRREGNRYYPPNTSSISVTPPMEWRWPQKGERL